MKTFKFRTKKFIAILVMVTVTIMALYQLFVMKVVMSEYIGFAALIVGLYFGAGMNKTDTDKEGQ